MNNFAVITTIFNPTQAVKKLATNNVHVIVAGDKKTPSDWHINGKNNFTFLNSSKSQGYKIEKVLPYNHYCRKMIGYIYAKNQGAEFIYETDDDNYPKDNWKIEDFSESRLFVSNFSGFVNVYNYFTDEKIWPRGYPLNLIKNSDKEKINSNLVKKDLKIGVIQGLVDEEPDVDAIYRLTSNKKCIFESKPSIALSEGIVCPYNSQNTFTVKELFTVLYLPSTVTFRFTDILRSFVAQPVMWMAGYHLCFTQSSAIQERNIHDYMKDFESEIPMYLYSEKSVEIAVNAVKRNASIKDNMYNVYQGLLKENIVKDNELTILEAWLEDI